MHFRLFCRYVLYLILSSVPYILSGQRLPVQYQTLGRLEDYSFTQCTDIYQDPTGLIWIGTMRGMDRWDGTQMHSYPYMPFDTLGMPSRSGCGSLTRDANNNLWFIGGGLVRYDLEEEKYYSANLSYNGQELWGHHIRYDQSGFLWLGAAQGIFKYYPERDSLNRIPTIGYDGTEIMVPGAVEFKEDTTGTIWMAGRSGNLFYFDRKMDLFREIPLNLPGPLNGRFMMIEMSMAPNGHFWIMGNLGEIVHFNPYNREFEWPDLPVYDHSSPTFGGGMSVDQQGRVWYGIDRGLMLYDPASGTLTRMDDPENPIMIHEIITDINGNILIATFNGVKLIDVRELSIRTITLREELVKEGVCWVTSATRDGDYIWIGSFNRGLIRYNLLNDTYKFYTAEGETGNISTNLAWETLKDRRENIWLMTGEGCLHKYDPLSDRFEIYPFQPNRMITEDNEGYFWILGVDRLLRFDPVTLDTTHFMFRRKLPVESLWSQLDCTPFIRDEEGIFWFGQGDGGLYRIDADRGEWNHYNFDIDNPSGLPDIHIKSLFCDSRGTIWIASYAGLSAIIPDPLHDTAITFDNSYINELGIKVPNCITEDLYGNVYVGDFNGMHVIRENGSYEFYASGEGLLPDFSGIWSMDTDSETGELYIGQADLMILPSDFLKMNRRPPPVTLTNFLIRGKTIGPGEDSPLDKSILLADRINLKYDQNFFRIDFAALQFSHPERNQYKYILSGVDQDTVYADNQSFAEYTELQPGSYTFWVTGAGQNGPWNPEGRSIDIRIHPPWYRSAFAYILYTLAFLAMLYGIISFRTHRLRYEKLRLEQEVEKSTEELREKNRKIVEMEQMKTRFFTDISHEIRTPLSLITGPLDNLIQEDIQSDQGHKWLETIRQNSRRLLHLVNQLLDIARLDAGKMKLVLEYSDVLKHLRILAHGYHSLAETNYLRLILDIPEGELVKWIDRDKIEKVTANLLANALKYTPRHGIVRCRIRVLTSKPYSVGQQAIRIIVADNGSGIPEHEKSKVFDRFYRSEKVAGGVQGGTGVGLSVTRDMIRMMHGEIILKSIEGNGSVFIATIPLGKDHLSESEYILKEEEQELEIESGPEETLRSDFPAKELKERDLNILLIEDNVEVRSFIKESLEDEYEILEAADGIKGWNMATSGIPDLIISDVMMPGMDGFNLCSKLKKDERTSHIPVIMLSARALDQDRLEGFETGADDYIIKPFSIEEISVRIRNLIKQRERLREKYSGYIRLNLGEMTVTTLDDQFLKKVTGIISENLDDFRFDVGALQEKMNMSPSNLYRKLKALTGESPVQLLKIMRLKMAALLIRQDSLTVTEVMLQVGFSNLSYFSRSFKEYFGVTPKAYQKSNSTN